jgi:hypothetical protein
MFPSCSFPAAVSRRKLFRPQQRPHGDAAQEPLQNGSSDAWTPRGSLNDYDPADFVRLVEAVVTLNLREAAAQFAAMMLS